MSFPCRKSKLQEYGCCVTVKPFWRDKEICFDKCLADELFYLWDKGIVTTGCCCGHGKNRGYIGVEERFILLMKKLGYKVALNNVRPNDEDSFIPKTKMN